MSQEWTIIAYPRLSCMVNSPQAIEREVLPRNASKTASKSLSQHVTLTTSPGQNWLLTVVPGATQSIRRQTSLKKTGGTQQKKNDRKEKTVSPPTQSQTSPTRADTACGLASPASDWSAMSVPAVVVDNLYNLRSRSQAKRDYKNT